MQKDECAEDASKLKGLKGDIPVPSNETDSGTKVKPVTSQPGSNQKQLPISKGSKEKNTPAPPRSYGKKKSQSAKAAKAAATNPSPQTEVPSSPKRTDAGSPRVHRSNSKHSLKRRGKDKEGNSRQANQAIEASTCSSNEPDQLNTSLGKLSLNGTEQVQSFIPAQDQVGNVQEDNITLVDNPSASNSAGTFTSSAHTPSNASPQLLPMDLSNSPPMPCPPFQFMPLQPNLYPLFMPAQMQDGRFVFVPVAYPMMNGNRPGNHYGGLEHIPQPVEGSDANSGHIPTPMVLAHPDYRFFPQDGNFTPMPIYDLEAEPSTSGAYRPPNHAMQPVFASPMPWSGHPPAMAPLPVVNPKGDVSAPQNFQKQSNGYHSRSKSSHQNSHHESENSGYQGTFDFSTEALEIINKEADVIFQRLAPQPVERERQDSLLNYLRNVLSQVFPDAELHPFGSTANGLGMANADMDLCVCFPNQIKSKVTAVEFVEHMGSVLHQDGRFSEVKPLTRTRIPIIKLKHKDGLCSDIGFENRLALWNTRLLKTYTEIDSRLQKLVFLVKHWSKQRSINEPYHGTLSSYCYVLMVIFFLQQRSPPVLPCLQKIHPPEQGTPRRDVDGHNVYFFEDLPNLGRYWQCENTETVAELLFGFFQYYAYNFHWSRSVVSVRTGSILTKEQKNWIKPKFSASPSTGASVADRFWLCVEDPFELDHNLGRPADRNSVFDIRGEFIRATKMLKARDPNNTLSRLFMPFVASDNISQGYQGYGTRAVPQQTRHVS
ncbi:hypothetical protein DSO57_1025950 [Entomophthora muscae]|uniref:Uncharacterized protein n=1 Tax=Entomophthora muscae TaxID=34485 RepID=A0ACC2U012_9FUNG|nr:hypothetical protein DSO57_1025950 [Entomophthora muscae]